MEDEEMCSDYDDDYFDDAYYQDGDDDIKEEAMEEKGRDQEDAEFKCLDTFEVERVLNENVATVMSALGVPPGLAKVLLNAHQWDTQKIIALMMENCEETLVGCGMKARPTSGPSSSSKECDVCISSDVEMRALVCGHLYCIECWRTHFTTKLDEGVASRIPCMHLQCKLICPEEFVLKILNVPTTRAKYERFIFRDFVVSHPELRFCIGHGCDVIIRSKERKAKRVSCEKCGSRFCVLCGRDYHAPTDCETIRRWLVKCADDSETANYISAHTKDCPQCHACIEKNGGCNHMQCAKCKHHFCWMCFGDWKTHGSEYYECSRYKENPEVAAEANHMKARRALEKYLHYYERFENHNKSLRLEEQFRAKIIQKIDTRVVEHDGTWIDWQYLLDATNLLRKCRYTLQYTYPFAYYMEGCARKELFEYQQGELEKVVEELAWHIERADSDDRGILQSFMHRAEHRRVTLLHDFFFSS